MAVRVCEQLLIMVHVEDDVETGGQIGFEHVVDARHENGVDRVGRPGERMGGEAHRQPHRSEARLANAGRVGVLECATPIALAGRFEHVGEVNAFAERQRHPGGRPRRWPGREAGGLRRRR